MRTFCMRFHRLAAGVLVPLLLFVGASPASAAQVAAVTSDADFIVASQLPSGALKLFPSAVRIEPYVSNYAAAALVRASKVTQKRSYADVAYRWLSWYAAHQQTNGIVDEFAVNADGSLTDTNGSDSVDGSGGTFLIAVRELWRLDHRTTELNALRPAIVRAVKGIQAMQDTDGLTWALPTYHVKYLMDQSEAYGGLLAGVELAQAMGDTSTGQLASATAAKIKVGVAGLWNASTSSYNWAKHEDGTQIPTNWTVIFPDAAEQAWAVAYGLAPSARAATLIDKVVTRQPQWAKPGSTSKYYNGRVISHPTGYWPVIGIALQQVGRGTEGLSGVKAIRAYAVSTGRGGMYNDGHDGQGLLAQTGGLNF